MTETTAAGCLMRKDDVSSKVGSAGRALMHSRIKIVDETGQTCARNVPGEIMFQGATVTPGYWRRPEANAERMARGSQHSVMIATITSVGHCKQNLKSEISPTHSGISFKYAPNSCEEQRSTYWSCFETRDRVPVSFTGRGTGSIAHCCTLKKQSSCSPVPQTVIQHRRCLCWKPSNSFISS